ncbi:hypothetical protein Leryth_023119 [Lithospermum erythrorhizon]|nr:hypothetical protein Leryth_023119 [Lithospermum erythrorhizon]
MGLILGVDLVWMDGWGWEVAASPVLQVSCSICLDAVMDNGGRSLAKLQCGHQFHLDCIGSAFNSKGAMQCPNCRKVEKGQWLYANGCRSLPEFSVDEWTHDEDLYDFSYSEMSFGVHWCPFNGPTRIPSSFEEGEFSSGAYHDPLGQNAIFAEHTSVSSSGHPCPYIAYIGPIHPSSSNASRSISDSSNFSSHWNGPSIMNEAPSSYTFPGVDVHHHSWEQHFSPFIAGNRRVVGPDLPSISSVNQLSARTTTEIPGSGSFVPPFLVGHSYSSAARAGSSVPSPMIPPYPGSVGRTRDLVQALQAYSQQPNTSLAVRAPVLAGTRRSNGHRGVSQIRPVASTDQNSGFYFFQPGPSGRTFPDVDNPIPSPYHSWEHDHNIPSFSMSQADRDLGWGTFHQAAGASDTGIRSTSFRQRHGNERMPSQNR